MNQSPEEKISIIENSSKQGRDPREILTAFHSGPLPPPSILEGYERVLPGSAERIVKMAETQSLHRQLLEKTLVSTSSRNSTMGLIFGFIIAVIAFALSAYLIYTSHVVVGGIMGSAVIVALVGVFVYGSKSQEPNKK